MSVKDLARMRRVTDMMLSAHSSLRDRYGRRARSLTLLIIALSIGTASLAFATGDSTVTVLSIDARLSRWVAVLSLLTFFLSMADLIFDWRLRSLEHGQAAARLSDLKQRLRGPQVVNDDVVGAEGVEADYERTMAVVIPIPDSQFATLKARHAHKVALSQAIDTHPGAPVWWVRLLVRVNGVRGTHRAQQRESLEAVDRGEE